MAVDKSQNQNEASDSPFGPFNRAQLGQISLPFRIDVKSLKSALNLS